MPVTNYLFYFLFVLYILRVSSFSQSYVPESNNPKMKVKPVVPIKAYPVNLGDVELLESPFREAMEADVAYLKLLEPDRLMSQFRIHAGLKPKA